MERFSVCENDSKIKTLPHPPGAHIRGRGGGGVLQNAFLGHKICGLIFEGLINRAYENTTFCMFIRNNLSVQNKFISIY